MKYHNYCAVQVKARQLQSQAESSVTEADRNHGGCRRLAGRSTCSCEANKELLLSTARAAEEASGWTVGEFIKEGTVIEVI